MKKRLVLFMILLFSIGVIIAVVYINRRQEDFDIRDQAAESEFDTETYRGMARFGIGRLTEVMVRSQDLPEYDEFKFGWYHNWMAKYDYFGDGNFPAGIPENLDYYGLIGGYTSNITTCPADLKDQLLQFKDGDVIWIGNEIGLDDKRDPHTYAEQYKSWYDCVKSVNPNIRVAPGANGANPIWKITSNWVQQWEISNDPQERWSSTNLIDYIEYMAYVKQDYLSIYGEEMPIDAYVIHVYPFGEANWHDVAYIESTIRAFRQYMKDQGEIHLPLFIKEMGILDSAEDDWDKNGQTMQNIYSMLLNLKDTEIGNPNDNNRLVQRWAWWWMAANRGIPYLFAPNSYLFECDPFYNADGSIRTASTHDCRTKRIASPLVQYHKEYVAQIWDSYDSTPPQRPTINYTLNGTTADVIFNAVDGGKINNYEISVGSVEGETDVMLWTSTDTAASYTIHDAVGRYVNVKAIDDGYNWSEVGSKRIEQEDDNEAEEDNVNGGEDGVYDIAPKSNPDEKVNMYDLTLLLLNWKWKKGERDKEADINKDGDVNMLDLSLLLNHWTKKY